MENMIKRTEIVYYNYSIEYLKSKISKDLSSEPKLSINLIKYFKEFDRYIDDEKRFSGLISTDKIELNSKSGLFWPRTTIEFEESDNQTKLKLTYKMYWLYVFVFTFLLISFTLGIYETGSYKSGTPLVFGLIFVAIALFGRFIQRNLIKYIVE